MSKIFDALQGTRSEVADLLPSLLTQEANQAPARTMIPAPPLSPAQAGVPETPAAAPAQVADAPQPTPAARSVRRISLAIPASLPVLPFDEHNEIAAEQYRIARTKIVHHPRRPRTIALTSPSTGDGKTVTAINLAGALSLKASSKVLLADLDFRRSTVHTLLGLPRSPGMIDVLAGECEFEDAVIEIEEYPNLNVITSGESTLNPSELLESARWHGIAAMLRERYEYVVMDAPPVGAVAEGDLINIAADGILLVLRPDHTNRSGCLKAISSVPKEKLLGVLLNCNKPWPFGKQGGYGYDYRRGKGYSSARTEEGQPGPARGKK